MEKKKGFILYFDILGYKSILSSNTEEENAKFADLLEEYSNFHVKSIVSLVFCNEYERNKLFYRGFSDNFLFLYELSEDDLEGLKK